MKQCASAATRDPDLYKHRMDNVIDRIDGVTGAVMATIPTGSRGPEDITTGAGHVWMSFNSSPVVQIEPSTNT